MHISNHANDTFWLIRVPKAVILWLPKKHKFNWTWVPRKQSNEIFSDKDALINLKDYFEGFSLKFNISYDSTVDNDDYITDNFELF